MNRIILLLAILFSFGACTNYGKKVKEGHIEVYYKEGITEREAEKTAKAIFDLDASNDPVRKSFQLLKDGDRVIFRMVVDEDRAKKMGDENFSAIASLVSDKAFDGEPVTMELTDTKFSTIRTIAFKKQATDPEQANIEAFGDRVAEGNAEVYRQGASEEEATKLAAYMNDYFKPETMFSFQLVRDEAGNYTVKMVGNPDKIESLPVSMFEEICRGVCDKVLSVPSVKFEMTDAKFNVVRTYNYPADTGDPDRNN